MSIESIYSAIITRYNSGDFGLETFWPNKNGDPESGVSHARLWFIPSGNDPGSLGGTGTDIIRGIAQIDLMYPDGKGIGDALAKADDIAAYFQRGQSQVYGTSSVVFTGAKILQPRNEDGWLKVPVSVGWYSHQARSVP